jgi:PKD repeat protein
MEFIKNKKWLMILFVGLFIIFSTAVFSTVYENSRVYEAVVEDDGSTTYTTNDVDNFNVIGYVCANAACDAVSATLWGGAVQNSGATSNDIMLTYPTILQSSHGYAIYYYKTGYLIWEQNPNWAGSNTPGTAVGPYDRYLSKKENCTSTFSTSVLTFNSVQINVTANAAINNNVGAINYIPPSLASYYEVETSVSIAIFNSTGSLVYSEIQIENISYSGSTTVVFDTWNPTYNDNFDVDVNVTPTDSKCFSASAVISTDSENVNVGYIDNSPTVEIGAPNGITSVTGNVTFYYNVTDDFTIDTCKLYHNLSGSWITNLTNNSVTLTNNNFVLNNLPNGSFIWNVECEDNNTQTSFATNNNSFIVDVPLVVVDNSPSITLVSPDGATSITGNVTFTFNVTDDYEVDNCTLYHNISGTWLSNETNTSITLEANTFDLYNLDNGSYVWNVMCFDNNSQSSFAAANFSFIVDIPLVGVDNVPSVTLVSPDGATSITGNVTFTFNVTDDYEVDNCTLYHNISGAWLANETNTSINLEANTFDLYNLDNGSYIWNVMCFDNNSQLSFAAANYSFVVSNPGLYPNTISLTPQLTTHNPGFGIQFNAVVYDQNGGVLGNTVTFLSDGLINSTGFFNSSVAGIYYVNASVGSVYNITNITVNESNIVFDSEISGVYYSGLNYLVTTSTFERSVLNVSNITGVTFTLIDSIIYNSIITNGANITNCNISDSTFGGYCLDSTIDPTIIDNTSTVIGSTVINSTVVNGSTVESSTLYDVIVANVTIDESSINNTNITNSNVTNATLINSTIENSNLTNTNVTNSVIENSTLLNNTVLNGNISNDVIYNGTITLSNGSTYNATQEGQKSLTDLENYVPTAYFTTTENYLSVTFNDATTDPNIPGDLNDSLFYFWDLGDGTNSTLETSFTYAYSSAGTYTVSLTVIDSFGEIDSYSTSITISERSSSSGSRSSRSRRASCTEKWTCGTWSVCDISNLKFRNCKDLNACETFEYIPAKNMSCEYIPIVVQNDTIEDTKEVETTDDKKEDFEIIDESSKDDEEKEFIDEMSDKRGFDSISGDVVLIAPKEPNKIIGILIIILIPLLFVGIYYFLIRK